MRFETKFSCGDKIFIVDMEGNIFGPYEVGQIAVHHRDELPGPDPASVFCNKRMQLAWHSVTYMCFETGVGTGTMWPSFRCFGSREDAAAFGERVAEEAKAFDGVSSQWK